MLRLVGASLNYSSWTVRAWLALEQTGAAYRFFDVGLKTDPGWKEKILSFSGAGRVPILIDGPSSVHESLAICETLAERFPHAQLWPTEPQLRARGRALACEMVSGFPLIRNHMPMNLRARATKTPSAAGLAHEIARIQDIWEACMATTSGDYLLGGFSIADCMYMPVVSRFRTYGVPLSPGAARFSEAIWEHPLVKKLETLAATAPPIPEYDAALAEPPSNP